MAYRLLRRPYKKAPYAVKNGQSDGHRSGQWPGFPLSTRMSTAVRSESPFLRRDYPVTTFFFSLHLQCRSKPQYRAHPAPTYKGFFPRKLATMERAATRSKPVAKIKILASILGTVYAWRESLTRPDPFQAIAGLEAPIAVQTLLPPLLHASPPEVCLLPRIAHAPRSRQRGHPWPHFCRDFSLY